MSLPNRDNLFQENAEEAWDDFFREEVPALEDGDTKLTVCEFTESDEGNAFEIRIDLPPDIDLEDSGEISAIVNRNSLVIRVEKDPASARKRPEKAA